MSGPTTAMVLAAGLGTRMRPLTDSRPKALVEVGGKALIDHMLDRLVEAGVRRAVVNVHAFADLMEEHLKRRRDLDILISDERAELMETGGGLKRARSMLGEEPILVANIDSVWTEGSTPAIQCLTDAWAPELMDDLLLLVPVECSLGLDAPGDFFRRPNGRLVHRGDAPRAPLAYIGVQMLKPQIIDVWPEGPQRTFPHWMAMAGAGRLHGAVMDGFWMHVGDPTSREAVEALLASAP